MRGQGSSMLWPVLALCLLHTARGQMFGFSELDFTVSEASNAEVTVTKSGSNVGDLFINIMPLTYAQLDSMGLILPDAINSNNRPDPAEFEVGGRQDFNNTPIQVIFPATMNDSQVEQNITIPIIDDVISEFREGFFLHATIDQGRSNPIDVQGASPVMSGVTLISINDNDGIPLTFEQQTYNVGEGDGLVVIFVIKEENRSSEQILRVIVNATGNPTNNFAIRGPLSGDYDYSTPAAANLTSPIELVFDVTKTRLNISIDLVDDNILETEETFFLQLSTPDNPQSVISQATVLIQDNEIGRIGFEQTKYNFSEADGQVDVCARLLEPAQAGPGVTFFIFAETMDGTATGGLDFNPLTVANRFNGDQINLRAPDFRDCAVLVIFTDSLIEGTENLSLRLVTDPDQGAANAMFIFEPNMTEVCIEDQIEGTTPTPIADLITTSTTLGMGGDPHYSILLPSGQQLCYSVQGQPDFAFNLISNKLLHMNALFIQDSRREEITWIGELGVVVRDGPKKKANSTALRFCASGHMVCIGDKIKLHASGVEKLTFSGGKLSIDEREEGGDKERPEVLVDFPDIGISFTVRFVRGRHLDMVWNKVDTSMGKSHGMIGQFFRKNVKIDEPRRLLLLPGGMEPVPVMRKPVWAFMERETTDDEQLCWVAMNPGYQGKKLLQGHYLDYLVDDVLSSSFKFKPKKH